MKRREILKSLILGLFKRKENIKTIDISDCIIKKWKRPFLRQSNLRIAEVSIGNTEIKCNYGKPLTNKEISYCPVCDWAIPTALIKQLRCRKMDEFGPRIRHKEKDPADWWKE